MCHSRSFEVVYDLTSRYSFTRFAAAHAGPLYSATPYEGQTDPLVDRQRNR